MDGVGDRVREAREELGISQSELARRAGVTAQTIQALEDGTSKGSTRIVTIARVLDVSPYWLADALGPKRLDEHSGFQHVPVVGRVSTGQTVVMNVNGPSRAVRAPLRLGEVVAFEVEGGSMWPRYNDGEIILYDAKRGEPRKLIGKECVSQLRSGNIYLKTLQKGSRPPLFTLSSHNAPPLTDVEIEWASPVRWPERID